MAGAAAAAGAGTAAAAVPAAPAAAAAEGAAAAAAEATGPRLGKPRCPGGSSLVLRSPAATRRGPEGVARFAGLTGLAAPGASAATLPPQPRRRVDASRRLPPLRFRRRVRGWQRGAADADVSGAAAATAIAAELQPPAPPTFTWIEAPGVTAIVAVARPPSPGATAGNSRTPPPCAP